MRLRRGIIQLENVNINSVKISVDYFSLIYYEETKLKLKILRLCFFNIFPWFPTPLFSKVCKQKKKNKKLPL